MTVETLSEKNPDLIHYIKHFVWSGFYSKKQILHIIGKEIFSFSKSDLKLLGEMLEAEIAFKKAAEPNWPYPTDCETLELVFDRLNQRGIIAIENAGNSFSDGITAVSEALELCQETGLEPTGFCFYHWQDLEDAISNQQLLLAFGALSEDEPTTIQIGTQIVEELTIAGFEVTWNQTIEERIVIQKIDWKKRGPV